jgi:hypothetical protein
MSTKKSKANTGAATKPLKAHIFLVPKATKIPSVNKTSSTK